jgi:hypothetical protein
MDHITKNRDPNLEEQVEPIDEVIETIEDHTLSGVNSPMWYETCAETYNKVEAATIRGCVFVCNEVDSNINWTCKTIGK